MKQGVVFPWFRNVNPLISVLPQDLKLLLQIFLQIRLLDQVEKTLLAGAPFTPEMGLNPSEASDYAGEMSTAHERQVRVLDEERGPFG
jgi:hypothetical protein